jgi:PilZ domain
MNDVAPAIATLDDGRNHRRTHLFVAATLYSDMGSVPVRIRNMSPSGALIESPNIPEPGIQMILRRGSLQIAGRIAWKAEQKAGIAFASNAYVADWMARQAGLDQERVDQIVADFKADGRSGNGSSSAASLTDDSSLETGLMALRSELAQLGNSLIIDTILVATHPEIQALDVSIQRIDRMIGQLRGA